MITRSLIVALCLCSFAGVAAGRTITVDDDQPADFTDIQSAINDANDGDTVLVADGTYTGPLNRDLDFVGRLITVRSVNGPEKTIIDCEQQGRGFYFHSDETNEAVVSGLSIVNGLVSDENEHGGGICIEFSGPVIQNCVIADCNTTGGSGGGIFCDNFGDVVLRPVIRGCVVRKNRAWVTGGGISLWNCDAVVENTLVFLNHSDMYTGGIECSSNYVAPANLFDVVSCTVVENSDLEGEGGISVLYDADVVIANTIVYGNVGLQIATYSGTEELLEPVVIYSDVQDGYVGKGNIDYDPLFVDPEAGDYHLKSAAGRWSGLLPTVAYDLSGDGSVNLMDFSIFAESWLQVKFNDPADFDGNGFVEWPDLSLFMQHYLAEPTIIAGDLNRDGSVNLVDFGIFAENWLQAGLGEPADLDGNGFVGWPDLELFVQDYLAEAEIDGLVFDSVTSPCIDAGHPAVALGAEPVVEENVRVNIGAYGGTREASSPPAGWWLLQDLDNSGQVDFTDYNYLAADWQVAGDFLPGDLSRDRAVDATDLGIFAAAWLEQSESLP